MNTRVMLEQIYKPMVESAQTIKDLLDKNTNLKTSLGFYNNHYHKNEQGEYIADIFPIPVITVNNLCDIEIDVEKVSITTKIKTEDAAVFDYSVFKNIEFEIYGVEDYLCDYYTNGEDIACIADRLRKSTEKELFFTLYLNNTDANDTYNAVSLISNNKFYY